MNRSRIIKIWNEIEFRLYVPKTIDKNNKIEVQFPYFCPNLGKNKIIKKSTGIDRYAKPKIYIQQANDLIGVYIDILSKGYNPIDGTFPDYVRLSPQSSIMDCIVRWLEKREADVESKVIKPAELEITQFVFDYYQKFLKKNSILLEKPSSFTSNDITLFMRNIEKNRKLSKVTYNAYLSRLSFFYKYLVNERLLDYNPCGNVERYKTKKLKTRFKIFEDDELATVKNLLETDKEYQDLLIAVNLLYGYRIRLAEQLRIQLGWIDWKKSLLILPETDEVSKENTTKNGIEATFELSGSILKLLENYIGDKKDKKLFLFGGHGKLSLEARHKEFLTGRWRRFRLKHNLPKHLKLYALKHTSNYNSVDKYGLQKLSFINRQEDPQQIRTYIDSKYLNRVIKIDEEDHF
jgi:integrase